MTAVQRGELRPFSMTREMKRDESPRAKLARLLREAIEAEELAEPDVAEIVRDAWRSWSTRVTTWKIRRRGNRPLHDSETAVGESFPRG